MHIEIDQSGHKIADTKGPTVLAFSNKESNVVIIPARIKRQCLQLLRNRYRQPRIFYLRLFCAGLATLLRSHTPQITLITIDQEYKGHDGTIISFLTEYVRRFDPSFQAAKVQIRQIGKQSPAHKKALATYRALRKQQRGQTHQLKKVTLQELLDFLLK